MIKVLTGRSLYFTSTSSSSSKQHTSSKQTTQTLSTTLFLKFSKSLWKDKSTIDKTLNEEQTEVVETEADAFEDSEVSDSDDT